MHKEHRMLWFAAGETPKNEALENNNPLRPQTMDQRAAERLRRASTSITPENARVIIDHVGPTGFPNETVTPELLREREAMVQSARQDILPMVERLSAALRTAGRFSPAANAILREITARLNAPLEADGRNRATTRAENDAIAMATALNGMAIEGAPQRLGVEATTDRDGRWSIVVSTVDILR